MSQLQQGREQWGSRLGFILACLGSAVGLGNIWRFSTTAGENGGGAFLLLYILLVLFIGIPVVMAEFTIGRKAQSDAVGSFQKLAPGKPWVVAGFMGVASAFIILSFYGVVAGWVMKYFFGYLTGQLLHVQDNDFTGYFVSFIGETYEPVIWQFIFMALTIGIVVMGVKKGIEASNKILMPLLGVLLIVLAGYSLTLGGAKEGLNFLFNPDWSKLAEPKVWVAALGQAFFSLSLGMGALITYGSYLKKENKLPSAALSVGILDTVVAIIAGIMIFPAVFAFGLDPAGGAGLVFMTLPNVFDQMTGGMIVGTAFFFLLFAAALSSAVSLLEVAVAYFMRRFNWNRKTAVIIIGGLIFLLGVPSSLSQGAYAINIMDKDFLTFMDDLSGNVFLPLGGLIIALFMGWGWNKTDALRDSDFGQTTIGTLWIWSLRIVAPVAILIIFLNKIGVINFS
ncbi:sodium-dependent transporter [Caldalkalibacillus mannanilyticus]|uniref:sodium-dependent transporter n=1 Tax=Caldalkalibacillus mannanilyticus TaxID=1418 RepID=UPI000469067D|nr:sodium-dependent transporter [Caldalkalibacillus mannanilyticus]